VSGMRRVVQRSVQACRNGAFCGVPVVRRSLPVTAGRAASTLVSQFGASVSSLPAREAVRYTEKNLKWTAEEFSGYVDAHANALLEQGFVTGEVIGVWLPESPEKHVTLMAAAKMGLQVVDFAAVNTVEDLRAILGSASIKALFFEPVNDTQDNLLLLRKAIPEFFYYDDSHGQQFHSKHFPSLQYFIHTGFDIEMGCLNYKSLFLHHPEESYVEATAGSTKDDMPLYAVAKAQGGVCQITDKASHAQVLSQASWGFAKKLVSKEYFEL
jgi:hypothetical protein